MDIQKHLGKIAVCAAALVLSGSAGIMRHNHVQDRAKLAEWSSLTNAIPQMIASGRVGEARDMYEDARNAISRYSVDEKYSLLTPITSREIKNLKKTLDWEAMNESAKQYHAPIVTDYSFK